MSHVPLPPPPHPRLSPLHPHPHPSQLMSYGRRLGEPYLSDITLALLEDTGHYAIQAGAGGSLVADLRVTGPCGEFGTTVTLDFLFGNYQRKTVGVG